MELLCPGGANAQLRAAALTGKIQKLGERRVNGPRYNNIQ
jgi:hypothetical protein